PGCGNHSSRAASCRPSSCSTSGFASPPSQPGFASAGPDRPVGQPATSPRTPPSRTSPAGLASFVCSPDSFSAMPHPLLLKGTGANHGPALPGEEGGYATATRAVLTTESARVLANAATVPAFWRTRLRCPRSEERGYGCNTVATPRCEERR